MLKIIDISQKEQWKKYVSQCDDFDFYHTWDYHKISKDNNEGEPELIVKQGEDYLIVFPFLKRKVTNLNGEIIAYDYTSAYGYVGPIFKGKITEQHCLSFRSQFQEHCNNNNIISVFSRLHPTIHQGFLLNKIGDVIKNSNTIQIDLKQSLEEQRKHYRKSNKSEINKLRKNSKVIWSDHKEEDIEEFIEIYEETMKRVNANERYFFSKDYYFSLFKCDDFKTQLIFVEMEGLRIAAALFVFSKNIIQYHLAGTRNDYMKITPMKLLLDEIRLYGTEKGYNCFHLGGGTTSSEQDPLFRFKRGFSKIQCEFNTFNYVVNEEIYYKLTEKLISNKRLLDSNFFPLYRA